MESVVAIMIINEIIELCLSLDILFLRRSEENLGVNFFYLVDQ